ncbi:MAG: GNAT family N-acetyltransferase [Vampirovibrionales bacterium]
MNTDLDFPTDCGCLVRLTVSHVQDIRNLAYAAWEATYKTVLTPEQRAFDFEREYALPVLEAVIQSGEQVFYGAWHQAQLVGFLAVGYNALTPETLWLHKFYLWPAYKGQGWGKRMLTAVQQLAHHCVTETSPLKSLSLYVNRHNPAVRFYERHQFTLVRSLDTCIGQDSQGQPYFRNDYQMEYTLAVASPWGKDNGLELGACLAYNVSPPTETGAL